MILSRCYYKSSYYSTKNAENDYFDQRLGCAAPKRWWKYTTARAMKII